MRLRHWRYPLIASLIASCDCGGDMPTPDAGTPDTSITLPDLLVEPDPSTLTVIEGQPTTFTILLSHNPAPLLTDLTTVVATTSVADPSILTLSPGRIEFGRNNWEGVTVTIDPQQDDDTRNETTEITIRSDVGDMSFTVTVVDDDAPNVVATPLMLNVPEGGTATFELRLSNVPEEEVTLTLDTSDPTVLGLDAVTLSFDMTNWDIPQTVTASAGQDADLENGTAQINIDNSIAQGATIDVVIVDDDLQAFMVSTASITIDEGATGTFDVNLAFEPSSDVNVVVTSSDPNVATADTATLTFTPGDYDQPQTVTVTGVGDVNILDDAATITMSSTVVTVDGTVDVTVIDDDTQIIMVSTATIAVAENGSANLSVWLGFAPSSTVAVDLVVSDASKLSLSTTSLQFSPADFSTPQMVTLNGLDDLDAAQELETVTLTSVGAGDVIVDVTILEDDAQNILTDTASVTLAEGAMLQVGVRLESQPLADATISVTSVSGTFLASPATLTFTPTDYDSVQVVTIEAPQDFDVEDESDTLELASLGIPTVSIPVLTLDDDVQAIVAAPNMIVAPENGTGTFNVNLAFQPSTNVSVSLAPADPIISAAPTPLIFTPTNWNLPQQVVVSALDDPNTTDETTSVAVTAAGLAPVSVMVSVPDDDIQAILLDANTLTVAENGTVIFNARLAFQPATPVTLTVQSSDPNAASGAPTTLTFDPINYATLQPVTVTGIDDLDVADETAIITVSGGGLPAQMVNVTVTDDDVQAIVASQTTVALAEGASDTVAVTLAFQPGASVTVAVASDNPSVTATPAMLTFTPGNYDTPQPITITGIQDPDFADEAATVTLSSAGLPNVPIAVTVTDDDTQALVVNPTTLSVNEGASENVSIELAAQPAGNVTVTLASSDTGAANPASTTLTFTPANYDTPQVVAVAGIADPDVQDENVQLTVSSAGLPNVIVAVTVVDDDVLNLSVTPTSLALVEGGQAETFTVQLTQQPAGDTTVTISESAAGIVSLSAASLLFTTGNWNIAQTVTVTPLDDPDAFDENVTLTVATAGLTPRDVTVTVADDENQSLIVSANTLALGEGDSANVTVRLAADPVNPATVTIVNPDTGAVGASVTTLTFTSANFSVDQTVTLTALDDNDTRDENVTITVSSAVAADETIAITITDDDVQALVLTTNTVTVDEGNSQVVGVSLAFDPVTPVTVTAVSSDSAAADANPTTFTFNTGNYATPQSMTVTGVQDDDTLDENETVTLSSGVTANQVVTVAVTDDDIQALILSTNALTLDEGDNTTFTVRLAFNPVNAATVNTASTDTLVATAAPATLNFTAGNWSIPQIVTVTAPQDNDAQDGAATVNVTTTIAPDDAVAITVNDDDVQALVVSGNTFVITEGATDTFTVALAFDPLTPVAVTVASSDAGAASALPATLNFNSGNYTTPQTVTITGVDDNDTADENVTLTVSGGGAAVDELIDVTVNDDDVQALIVSQTTVVLDEGDTDTSVTVSLAFDPVNAATVNVASTDPGAASALPATLTFNSGNYTTPQTVTITGVQDPDLADENVTVSLATTIATNVDVDVTVNDDDVQALSLTPATLTIDEGDSDTFNVRLTYIPPGPVTVAVASTDTGAATALPATLNFLPGNYDTPQTVTVAGVQDVDLANENVTINVTSAGIPPEAVAVSVTDDDIQAFVIAPTTVAIDEGNNDTFNVNLQFQPAASVVVTVASNDALAASAAPATLTFTPGNYSVAQPVTVTAPQDNDTRDENVTITMSAASVPANGTVAVAVNDTDVQALVVTPTTLTVTEEAAPGSFDVSFAFEPDANTTVSIVSTDTGAAAVAPGTLTFTPGNYATPQSVSVTGVSDLDVIAEMVNVNVTTAIAPAELVVVTVLEDDVQGIDVSTNALTVTEDVGPGSFTVALDFMPQANTTVTIATSDANAATATPVSLTFTPGNYATPQTVTVNGTTDVNQVDTSATLTVSSAGVTDELIAVTVLDDDDQSIILSRTSVAVDEGDTDTFTVALAFQPLGGSETISLVSADVLAASVNPTSIVFNNTTYATPVTVTVTGVTDADILDETVNVDVTSNLGGTPARAVTVDVNDLDVQDIILSDAAITIDEGGQPGSVTVRLAQDPSGSQAVTITSLDTGAVTTNPTTLTFTSGNYTTPQTVTISAEDDVDVRDESVDVEFTTAFVTGPRVTTVSVNDDDVQGINATPDPVAVDEGDSANLLVNLDAAPTTPLTVTVVSADPSAASVSPASLVFTAANYATNQTVVVTGVQDADIDDVSTTITLSTGAVPVPEGAPDVVVDVDVTDDDVQVIIAESIPTTLGTSVQEGGPTVTFEVSLGFPPLLADGGTDTVDLTSTLPNVTLNPTSIVFNRTNFGTPVTVTVTAGEDANEVTENTNLNLVITGEASATHALTVIDDEIAVITSAAYPTLTGATMFTRRQNLAWGSERLGVVGFDSTSGDTVIASNTRELNDALVGAAVSTGNGAFSAQSVDFDGTTFGFFNTDGAGIEYVRTNEDAQLPQLSSTVVAANALNFWPAFDGTNDYGLVYRESGVASDRLRFLLVDTAGVPTAPIVLTIIDGSDDVQPNAHFNGTGYTILYSSSTEVRCVRTTSVPALVPGSDTALTGFPVGGAFVSSVYTGTEIVAAYFNATNSVNVVRINPTTCAVIGTHEAVGLPALYLSSPPTIGYNGQELVVLYDYDDAGASTIGAITLETDLTFRDATNIALGTEPSVTWAGDRWAARYDDGTNAAVAVGSFSTTCSDGIQNFGEAGIDCGGTCRNICERISCLDILNNGESVGDGVYEIDPDLTGPNAPFDVYCDMTRDGGGWTLMLSSTLDGVNGPDGLMNGTGVNAGTPSPAADYRMAADSTVFTAMGVTSIRTDVNSTSFGLLTHIATGLNNLVGFSTDSVGCNTLGLQIGPNTHWHPGRHWPCFGSGHFGVSQNAGGDNHIDNGEHYGHFHRINIDTGVYWMGSFGAGTNVNEVEWLERYRFWLR